MTAFAPAASGEQIIVDAVSRLGLLPVMRTAIGAWWRRPRLPQPLPDSLRADFGLSSPPVIHYPSCPAEIRFHYR
ncbi:hypothetical protein [Devosia sp.]|uniref:hypothetical protein n=1 Tax=Devosia sp. TaxID=1871048 RepID=UPI003265606C